MPDIEIVGPSGPDNFERGDKALHAVAFYMQGGQVKGIDAEEVLELGDNRIEIFGAQLPEGSPIPYLIADLCHLLHRYGFSIEDAMDHGLAHYASDVIEQAWTHDEEWNDELQSEDNIQRAINVMQTASVPEHVHHKALRMVGLARKEED